jgi:hypothetical protein
MPGDAADARRFAVAECNRLAKTQREVVQTENGKWRAQQTAVTGPVPAWPKDHEIKIVYQSRPLLIATFDTKAEAQHAELLRTKEDWTEITLWYDFQNGKWTLRDR